MKLYYRYSQHAFSNSSFCPIELQELWYFLLSSCNWVSACFVLCHDPIKTHSVFPIFRLILFARSHFCTFPISTPVLSLASSKVAPTAVKFVSSANILGVGIQSSLANNLYKREIKEGPECFLEECHK